MMGIPFLSKRRTAGVAQRRGSRGLRELETRLAVSSPMARPGLYKQLGDLHLSERRADAAVSMYTLAVNEYLAGGLLDAAATVCRKAADAVSEPHRSRCAWARIGGRRLYGGSFGGVGGLCGRGRAPERRRGRAEDHEACSRGRPGPRGAPDPDRWTQAEDSPGEELPCLVDHHYSEVEPLPRTAERVDSSPAWAGCS